MPEPPAEAFDVAIKFFLKFKPLLPHERSITEYVHHDYTRLAFSLSNYKLLRLAPPFASSMARAGVDDASQHLREVYYSDGALQLHEHVELYLVG